MTDSSQPYPVYVSGILLATFSFVVMLLILPPMFWHLRNRNIGATALVAWLVVLLLFNFTNAILWPTDDWSKWYNGVGLCDVEVKIQVASEVALPASFACILRALATVLNTERANLIQTKAQRRRSQIIDLLWCLGFPLLQMPLHYIVQPYRYCIYGVAGCTPVVSNSWPTILLILVPTAIWIVIDLYFAVLIVIRLYRYRVNFSSILASSSTTKSRFIRLYLICVLWILFSIPLEIWLFCDGTNTLWQSYDWTEIHSAKNWSMLILVRSQGKVRYDRWIPLAFGFLVFVFFGFGKEAVKMYQSGFKAIGLSRIWPCLDADRASSATTIGSFSSRAKLLLRRNATKNWASGTTTASQTTTLADTPSLKEATVDDKVQWLGEPKTAAAAKNEHLKSDADVKQATSHKRAQSWLSRVYASTRRARAAKFCNELPILLEDLSGEQRSVHSAVTGGIGSPTLSQQMKVGSSNGVLVRKEVRQGSEHEGYQPTIVNISL